MFVLMTHLVLGMDMVTMALDIFQARDLEESCLYS